MGTLLSLGPIRSVAKTYATLKELSRPVSANEPESVPHVLFDTQQYAAAGSQFLQFYQSTAANIADPTLSNFATGTLDKDNWFEIHRMFVIIHALPNANATTAITGAANDVEILHKTARGVLTWYIKTKNYGPYPLAFFGRPGGPTPFYAAYGTGTVANNVITAGETESNGGFPVLGNEIISPQVPFKLTMQFVSTAISAATYVTHAMLGVLHRTVN